MDFLFAFYAITIFFGVYVLVSFSFSWFYVFGVVRKIRKGSRVSWVEKIKVAHGAVALLIFFLMQGYMKSILVESVAHDLSVGKVEVFYGGDQVSPDFIKNTLSGLLRGCEYSKLAGSHPTDEIALSFVSGEASADFVFSKDSRNSDMYWVKVEDSDYRHLMGSTLCFVRSESFGGFFDR
ncbi:hypothetical protein GP5015_448 [gamma proteobacterium HTCC5015]|nr:hypothetical protein GP5015_448 [gamma proteobacterium HTCC5015]